jgi:hypothetical protein
MPAARRLRSSALCLLCALGGAAEALAHDYWLELSTYRPKGGDRVAISHRVGERLAGDAVPRNPLGILRFDAFAPSGTAMPVPGRDGFDPAGVVIVDSPGTWRVVFQSRPSYVELPPEKFDAYLELEGIEGVREEREKLGEGGKVAREAFSRSAVAVSCASGGLAPPAAARGPVGLELEIVPDGDLCAARPGKDLGFRLLFRGQPAAGVMMMALDQKNPGEPIKVRTDTRGRFRFRLPRAGFWLVKGVAMERSTSDANADWQSRWASLTLELGEGAP